MGRKKAERFVDKVSGAAREDADWSWFESRDGTVRKICETQSWRITRKFQMWGRWNDQNDLRHDAYLYMAVSGDLMEEYRDKPDRLANRLRHYLSQREVRRRRLGTVLSLDLGDGDPQAIEEAYDSRTENYLRMGSDAEYEASNHESALRVAFMAGNVAA